MCTWYVGDSFSKESCRVNKILCPTRICQQRQTLQMDSIDLVMFYQSQLVKLYSHTETNTGCTKRLPFVSGIQCSLLDFGFYNSCVDSCWLHKPINTIQYFVSRELYKRSHKKSIKQVIQEIPSCPSLLPELIPLLILLLAFFQSIPKQTKCCRFHDIFRVYWLDIFGRYTQNDIH